MFVEADALLGMTEKFRQDALALPDRCAPQVLAIEFEQVEREQHGGGIVTVPADQVENGEPLSLQTTASPSIRHERTGSTVNAAMTCGKRLAKLMTFLVSSRTRPSARRAMMRNPSCLIS